MNIRHAIGALAAAAAVTLLPASAAWADYPPASPTAQLFSSATTCSDSVGVSGSNWKPNSPVDLTLHSDPVNVGQVMTDNAGTFSTSFVVPKGTAVGSHVLVASGLGASGAAATQNSNINVSSTNCATSAVTPPVSVLNATIEKPGGVGSATQVAGTQQSKGTLPFTGAAAVGFLLAAGLCLLLTGSISVLAARRRAHNI